MCIRHHTHCSHTFTNMIYQRSPYLGVGLMFSRGGFVTQVSQTGPSEKTLWAVPLYAYKGVKHTTGDSYDDIFHKLPTLPWSPPGLKFRLRWRSTQFVTLTHHTYKPLVH